MQDRNPHQAPDNEPWGDIGPARHAAHRLRERQRDFAAAILDPGLPIPWGLVGPDGVPSAKRFAVYRNNVVAGLVDALRAAFPVVMRLVGDTFFSAMARVYVAREPPQSPGMLGYGATFADFIGTFEPASGVPYLRDVARLERAWTEAYHAADASPIAPHRLRPAGLRPELLSVVRLVLHPSLRVLRSSFPVVAIWQMNLEDGVPGPLDIEGCGENALVVRPGVDVEIRKLAGGAADFIEALADGTSVIDATALALCDDPDFDLASVLKALFEAGLVIGWTLREDVDLTATARFA